MTPLAHTLEFVADGFEKTRIIEAMGEVGALDPMIRDTAVELVRTAGKGDHIERLKRIHRFVRDSVPYHREPIEMLHPAGLVLTDGGDCDDHAILIRALAWALKYPSIVEPYGNPAAPIHYTMRIGFPESETIHGDPDTIWIPCETTIAATFGEHVSSAARRLP